MKIEDEPGQATIGRIYEVPLAFLARDYSIIFRRGECVPIIGPGHDDPEINPQLGRHWHIDWRFVDARAYRRTVGLRGGVRFPNATGNSFRSSRILMADIIHHLDRGARKCRRLPVQFPTGFQDALGFWHELKWQASLEQIHAKDSAACGKCPHRGFPLQGQPFVEGTRVRVCPGHGLAWDEEGRLVPRREIPQAHGYE